MTPETVITIILAPACVVYLIVTRRAIRRMRQGDEEWRQRWRQLDPPRRKAIRAHMKRGEAVPDREDAELAIRAVAQIDYVKRAMAPMTLFSVFLVVVFLGVGVVSGDTIFIVIGAVGAGSALLFDVLARRQGRRYRQSVAATRAVHGGDAAFL
jgi:hypothetical protein